MPTNRRRRSRGPAHRWTLKATWASIELWSWIEFWGGEDEAREAWKALRSRATGCRLHIAPYWAYEVHVPEELRTLDSVELDADGNLDDDSLAALKERRRVWLAKHHPKVCGRGPQCCTERRR